MRIAVAIFAVGGMIGALLAGLIADFIGRCVCVLKHLFEWLYMRMLAFHWVLCIPVFVGPLLNSRGKTSTSSFIFLVFITMCWLLFILFVLIHVVL